MSIVFKQIEIRNFRGIKHCDVNNLSDVNVFFGRNNSGKSSLLEALFLLTGPSNPAMPLVVNNLRGLNTLTEDNLALDFYSANPDNSIIIEGRGDHQYRDVLIKMVSARKAELKLKDNPQLSATDNKVKSFGIDITFKTEQSGKTYKTRLTTSDGLNGTTVVDNSYKEEIFSEFLPSRMSYNDREKLHKMFQEKQEQILLDALRVIEPHVRDVVLSGDMLMVDVGMPTRLPVNVLGDGVRKVLSFVLSVMNCRNGILLVDEIENGLHYSAMEKLWNIILELAKEQNVQIFITTHSYDVLEALSKAWRANNDLSVSAYKLMRREDDEISVLAYNKQELSYAMEQNMEVR